MNITEFKYRCTSDKEAVVLYRQVVLTILGSIFFMQS